MPKNLKCILCNIYLRKVSGYEKTILTEEEAHRISEIIGVNVKVNDKLCSKYRSFVTIFQSSNIRSVLLYLSEIQPSTSSDDAALQESFQMLTLSPSNTVQSALLNVITDRYRIVQVYLRY